MCNGIVVYSKHHLYEPAFYEKLCAKYDLHPLPVDNPANSFRRVKVAVEKGEAGKNIFVVHKGYCVFFGDFETKARQFNYNIYHIQENSRLLHCLTVDEATFKTARGVEYPNVSDLSFCDSIYNESASLCISYEAWVDAIDLDKVITSSDNDDVFGELSKFLGLH